MIRPRVRHPMKWMVVVVEVVGFVSENRSFVAENLRSSTVYAERAMHYHGWLIAPQSAGTGSPNFQAKAQHYMEMQRKYRRAAWLPWLPVEPDPPEPDLEMPRQEAAPRPRSPDRPFRQITPARDDLPNLSMLHGSP